MSASGRATGRWGGALVPAGVPLHRSRLLASVLVGTAVAAAAIGLWLVVARVHGSAEETGLAAVSQTSLEQGSGVHVTQLVTTGGGGLVDLRYQVVEPDKAVAVHDRKLAPAIIDEASGQVVSELLMGHRHSGQPRAGVTYYLLFVNRGAVIKPGSTVSVRLGRSLLEHVPVG